MKTKVYIILFLLLSLFACNTNEKKPAERQSGELHYYVVGQDSSAVLVADSVIYTVYLKNPDTLDQWRSYTLRYVNRDKLVDMIFNDIYSGKLTAYSYRDWIYGDKVIIPVDSVKKLEKLKPRIGQVEFVERWFYSPVTNSFYKQVLEMTLAYELYDTKGNVRGYAPLFKVSFNKADNKPVAK